VNGLLDLTDELLEQRESGREASLAIDEVWHNTFSQTMGPDVEERFLDLSARTGRTRSLMSRAAGTERSIRQGDELTREAAALGIEINSRFVPRHLITVEDVPEAVEVGNLRLQVVGPTAANLERLRTEWVEWLEEHDRPVLSRDPAEAARAALAADSSIPNLSSIMLLVEAGDRRVLLTGDGRGDDLLEGLEKASCLGAGERLHVDLLKVPHHGSMRNVTPSFFRRVTADRYLISANGKHHNPDLETLRWIVEAAREQGRPIEILVTNATEATRRIVTECDPAAYGYQLLVLAPGEHSAAVTLGEGTVETGPQAGWNPGHGQEAPGVGL
jgi:hypothetical protein